MENGRIDEKLITTAKYKRSKKNCEEEKKSDAKKFPIVTS